MIKFNDTFSPMLLKEVYQIFNDEKYLYEVKYDGVRALIYASPNSFNGRKQA